MEYTKELHEKARKIVVADSLTDKEVFALLDEIERLQTFEKTVYEWSKRIDVKIDNLAVKNNQVIKLMEHYRSECERLQKLHEWIPVEDRFPELPNWVIGLVDSGGYKETYPVYFVNGKWHDDDGTLVPKYSTITHWQPLPQPPEAK